MAWIILAIAVVTEIIWALSLKWAQLQQTLAAAAVPIGLSFVNMWLLSLAMKGISAGTAYAIWTGLGAVGVIIGGAILFGERIGTMQMFFMAMIVCGVIGTKLFAQS